MKLILILIAALSVYFSKKRKGSESIKNSQDNNQLLKSKIWKNKDFQHLYPEASKQLKRLSLKKKGISKQLTPCFLAVNKLEC